MYYPFFDKGVTMNRDNLIKFIPKPSNQDVILYDIELKDLIDANVLQEYNKLYPIFINKRNEYLELKTKLEEYQKSIDNIYLYKPNWKEEDYLQGLKDMKKTYSTMFGEIKKTENSISMLQRNLKGINEKIQIQIAKENKKNEDKKQNINKDVETNKENLLNLKNYLDTYKLSLKEIENQIQENEEDFQMLSKMESKLEEGKCQCEFCGRMIKSVDEDSIFYKRLANNFEKNKKQLESLLAQKEKLELNISYYESEIQKVKDNLNNDIQFMRENHNFYQKKSIEVLKLEALRDDMINNISKLEKQLENNSRTKTNMYLELKEKIEKYELSLSNLKKIKDMKSNSDNDIQHFNNLKLELKEMLDKINLYIKYLDIYYKILAQKASEYCGKNYKFKFHKIEDYKLIPILEIYYDDIEYNSLNSSVRQEVDKTLIEKFEIYF